MWLADEQVDPPYVLRTEEGAFVLLGFTTHNSQHHADITLHVHCVYDCTIQGYNVSLELFYIIREWFRRVSVSILCVDGRTPNLTGTTYELQADVYWRA